MLLRILTLLGCAGALLLTFSGRVWALPLAVALWAAHEKTNEAPQASRPATPDEQNNRGKVSELLHTKDTKIWK